MSRSQFNEHPRLDAAIIPLHFMPDVELPDDQKPIPVDITGPTELSQGERSIDIKTQLLAYNALLLCRDKPMANGELRDLGLSVHMDTLKDHLGALAQKLRELTTENVLDKQGSGRWTTYRLSPRLQLMDKRQDINSSLQSKLRQLAIDYPQDLADFNPTQPVTFKDEQTRRTALAMTIRDHSALPEVRRALRSFHTLPGFAPDREGWEDYVKPSQEECVDLFTKIEYGLASAILDDNPGHNLQPAIDMVVAYHQLFFGHLFMAKYIADILCRSAQEHAYLFEIGSSELLKAIMKYKLRMPDGQEGGTFASLAYETIFQSMRNYKALGYDGPYNVPKSLVENQRLVAKAYGNFIAKHNRTPTSKEMAEELGLTVDQIKTAMSFSLVSKDIADLNNVTDNPNQFEDDLRSYMAEVEIHDMFRETNHPDSLTDREKIVLSLRYAIFLPPLAGTEIRAKGEVAFTYPHSVENLPQCAPSQAQVATMLGSSEMTINRAEKTALHKARRILLDWGVNGLEIY